MSAFASTIKETAALVEDALDAFLPTRDGPLGRVVDAMRWGALEVLQEQSPKQLLKVRGRLYELLSSCIPPEMIMKGLTTCLLRKVPPNVRHEAVHHAAMYEHRMQSGWKPIFHIEAFVARFMSILKRQQVVGRGF